jgi:glutathione S-transferase
MAIKDKLKDLFKRSKDSDIILFDYQYAPNAQRARNLLNVTDVPYTICEQPFVQPRPILQDLGIQYRRVPVNAIGKDVYVDNRVFLDAILTRFASEKGVKELVRTKHDNAYEAFGYRMFWNLLDILPDTVYNDDMIKDRKDLFDGLSRPDYREVRPSNIEAFKEFMDIIEHEFLKDGGPWIMGDKPGIADLQAAWIPKFTLETIAYSTMEGQGMGKDRYPKTHKWLSQIPDHVPENQPDLIDGEEAKKKILASQYTAKEIGVQDNDVTGFKKGDKVTVGTTDDTNPGNRLQPGKLVGLDEKQIVIELENGLRVHFSRIGYAIKKA